MGTLTIVVGVILVIVLIAAIIFYFKTKNQ